MRICLWQTHQMVSFDIDSFEPLQARCLHRAFTYSRWAFANRVVTSRCSALNIALPFFNSQNMSYLLLGNKTILTLYSNLGGSCDQPLPIQRHISSKDTSISPETPQSRNDTLAKQPINVLVRPQKVLCALHVLPS